MGVLLLTVFLSLLLASLFVWLHYADKGRRGFGSAERDALLPFEDETGDVPADKSRGADSGSGRGGDDLAKRDSENEDESEDRPRGG